MRQSSHATITNRLPHRIFGGRRNRGTRKFLLHYPRRRNRFGSSSPGKCLQGKTKPLAIKLHRHLFFQQAVYSVFKKDSNICSLRVLETGLNISELLLDLGVMKLSEHAHKLSMGITKRALLHLGCPHGCNDGIRGPPAEFLRTQCHTILSRMLRTAAPMSRNYLRDMVRTSPLHELVEFFHAFVGFCVDPSSLLSPLSKFPFRRVSH